MSPEEPIIIDEPPMEESKAHLKAAIAASMLAAPMPDTAYEPYRKSSEGKDKNTKRRRAKNKAAKKSRRKNRKK